MVAHAKLQVLSFRWVRFSISASSYNYRDSAENGRKWLIELAKFQNPPIKCRRAGEIGATATPDVLNGMNAGMA